jgi:hypothetical protein
MKYVTDHEVADYVSNTINEENRPFVSTEIYGILFRYMDL